MIPVERRARREQGVHVLTAFEEEVIREWAQRDARREIDEATMYARHVAASMDAMFWRPRR